MGYFNSHHTLWGCIETNDKVRTIEEFTVVFVKLWNEWLIIALFEFSRKNKINATVQSGFRKQRGTLDHLVRSETFIREAFIKQEHVVSVFFDFESAYDTTWKYIIMNNLHDFVVRGRLAYFISAFLNERQLRVRVGGTFSTLMHKTWAFPREAFFLLHRSVSKSTIL